ncbi:transcription factor GTE4-like [Neltuma alba]|uniref:transcription factor GTE4-like n=1 Tax=Neltuma alba TaxID=207710 RepID=UPI0010A463F1|nr:transcription factor GTE4-like [Prosopis alba]
MASGPIVGGDDGAKVKQRYNENKVYTRKAYKGPKNRANALSAVVPNAAPATTTANKDDINNNNSMVKNDNVVETEKNENNESAQEQPQTILPEDGNSAQPLLNPRPDAVSDDSSTLKRQQNEPSSLNCQLDEHSSPHHQQDEPSSSNRQEEATPRTRELPSGNGAVKSGLDNRIKINLSSRSKQEVLELKRKLENELDTVRSLVRKIEVKLGQIGKYGKSNPLVSDRIDNGIVPRRVQSEGASVVPQESIRPSHRLNLSVLENSHGASEIVEKEKRTPKANQLYRNSEFLLGKDKFPPAESNKKSKLNGKKQGGGEMRRGFGMGSKVFKSCSSLLEKLMKHKHGWVFNAPVDVEGLGLQDYFSIISHPMDLGTVKTRLNKNWYKSPKEFAEDVRLTFRNAMKYNPPGQDVHVMADLLSKIFEDKWATIESDFNREIRYAHDYGTALPLPSPMSRNATGFLPPPLDMRRILDRSESMMQTPKYLQSLPPEKLDAIVQIIKKRNTALSQHDDEIEVDIDSVDTETLWELDRFVTNYKKSLSKNKRKAELAIQRAESAKNAPQKASDTVEVPKENLADERNVPPSLPARGYKPLDNGSRSSSSSSSSSDSGSSSTDSDTESSSASGSDAGSQGT